MGSARLIKKGYDLLTPHCDQAILYHSIQFYCWIDGTRKSRKLIREIRYRCWHREPPWEPSDNQESQTEP